MKLLLIEDDPAQSRLVQEMLGNIPGYEIDVVLASRLADGLKS